MLSNIRVLDLTGDRGEIAGFLLAQHEADVVVVEPPGGSPGRRSEPLLPGGGGVGASAWWQAFGRGKRSVVLDLHDPSGHERFVDLLRGADVLLESWSNDVRAGFGLTPGATAAINPRLVHATISPFGSDGPKADWAATDLTVMAAASPLSVTGDRDRAPVRMSSPQAFCFAGAAAAGAVLIALYEREASGLGQHVDVSAQQAAALATQTGLLTQAVNAPLSLRSAGGASMGRMSLRFLYPAKDGYVSITHVFGGVGGASTGRLMDWVCEAGFCDEATRDKDWVRYPELVESGEEPLEEWERVKDVVAAFTSSLPKADLLQGAIARKLFMAPVSDLREVLDSPHLAVRGFFESTEGPGTGPLRTVGRYLRSPGWTPAPLPPAPALGEHTDEVAGAAAPDRGAGPSSEPARTGDAALAGLKVVDLTWSVAGPAMTRVLADHGATVVKVESVRKLDAARAFLPFWNNTVDGVNSSALFDNLNAGKRSLALDLSSTEGRAVLDDLLRWADVVIDSFSPRGRSSMGLDDERVRALNPSIVNMSVTLFGLDGPMAELAGYGNLGAALAGCYGITGWPDRPPAGPYLAYTDYTSAHCMLATLMAALVHRQATGEGCFIELSQSETAMQFLAPALLWTEATGTTFDRMGNDDLAMAPHGVYPCSGDDRWVAVACQDDAAWAALTGLLDRADLAADTGLATAAGRLDRRRELDGAVSAWTSSQDPDAVTAACQAVGVAAHTVQNSPECLADPQFAHRGHIVWLDHPERRCVVEGTRFRLARTPGFPQRHAPLLGEDTFEVLTEVLGYDGDRIADLAAAEVLE